MNKYLIKSNDSFEELLNTYNFKTVAFDLETTGLNPRTDKVIGISLANPDDLSFYIPVGKKGLDRNYVLTELSKKFSTSELIIGHNIKFDFKFLDPYLNYDNINIFDTMIAHILLNENDKHGLKHLAKKLLFAKTQDFDDLAKGYESFEDIPIEQMFNYACNDAIFTYRLYEMFKSQLQDQDLIHYFEKIEMPFVKIATDIELHGVRVDEKLLDHFIILTDRRISELKTIIHKRLGTKYQMTLLDGLIYDLNIDSSQQLGKRLFEDFEPLMFTEKGNAQVTMEHFEILFKKTQDILFDNLIEYSKLKKLFNAYLKPYKEKLENGKIYPDIIQHRTVTGRLSSANPNIMQLPRPNTYKVYGEDIEIRKLFLPDEGYKMTAGDYSQEELRIAAVIADETNMFEEFEKGFDMHLAAANRVFKLNIPEAGLVDGSEEFEDYKKKYKKERQNAKAISFGLLFGKTTQGFAESLDLTLEDAESLVNDYFGAYPNLKKAIDKTQSQVRARGWVSDLFGRRRRFVKNEKGYYDNRSMRQAFNFRVQGSAASLLKYLCVKIKEQLPEFELLFTVHDEVVLQTKQNYLNKLKYLVEHIVKLPVSLKADFKIGNNYYEVK